MINDKTLSNYQLLSNLPVKVTVVMSIILGLSLMSKWRFKLPRSCDIFLKNFHFYDNTGILILVKEIQYLSF